MKHMEMPEMARGKKIADAADAILAGGGEGMLPPAEGAVEAPAPAAPPEAAAPPMPPAPTGEPASDVAPLVAKLGVSEEEARDLLEAAKQFKELRGLDAAALADRLAQDFDLRMRVETEAARLSGKRSEKKDEESELAEAGSQAPKPAESAESESEEM